MDILKKTSIRKLSGDKSPKPSITSLQTPKLLKNYRKKRSVSVSGRSLRKPMNSPRCLGLPKYFDVSRECNSNSDSGLKPKSLEPKTQDEDLLAGSLTDVLSKLSLRQYVDKFREQEVDMNTFQYLTENDLNEIGISSESQKKLMEIITKLKNA
ncbi:Protein bicaudal C-like protein, partial [Stegodyphus mimosarum]